VTRQMSDIHGDVESRLDKYITMPLSPKTLERISAELRQILQEHTANGLVPALVDTDGVLKKTVDFRITVNEAEQSVIITPIYDAPDDCELAVFVEEDE